MTAVAPPRENSFLTQVSTKRRAQNTIATVLVTVCLLIALIPLVWVLWTVVSKGLKTILHADWWTGTQRNIGLTDAGGGTLQGIVGTLEQVAICTVVSVPIALLIGVYLVEYGGGRLAKITTFMVDILTGIPSIVAALFIFAVFVQTFHTPYAGYLVALALVILMIPVIVRTTEEMLRLVPNELREASYALGVPKWKTITKIVIPTAFTGLITGVVLGIARVAGETAPALILAGYADDVNSNPLDGSQTNMTTFIRRMFQNSTQVASGTKAYTLDAQGNKVYGQAAANFAPDRLWGAALTLILIILLLNLIARLIGRFNKVAK